MKKTFGILIPLILWTPLIFAQVKFTATASKTNVGMGERFEISFLINAQGDSFTPPDLKAFQLLAGPSLSNSVKVVNGDTTFNSIYSYIVVGPKEGAFSVGAASIMVSGQAFLSNPLNIKVKGPTPPIQQQIKIPDPFAAEDSSKSAQVDIKNLAKEIFIRAEADKAHGYVGEQIKVTYKLYTHVNIIGSKMVQAPSFKGFLNQKGVIPDTQKNLWTTENVGGVEYNVLIINQYVVSPEYAGYLTISPLIMTANLQVPEEGAFDNPSGNYHQLQYELKTSPVIIHAIALRAN